MESGTRINELCISVFSFITTSAFENIEFAAQLVGMTKEEVESGGIVGRWV